MNLNIKLDKYRTRMMGGRIDSGCDDETLAPVMPAIDVVQQLIEEESRSKKINGQSNSNTTFDHQPGPSSTEIVKHRQMRENRKSTERSLDRPKRVTKSNPTSVKKIPESTTLIKSNINHTEIVIQTSNNTISQSEIQEEDDNESLIRNNPLFNIINNSDSSPKQEEYEFIPKSIILDVYSNDPEVKRFLKQLPRIFNESGYNEQDYKCYSCRRPIGLVFGQSRLCHFDGHHYCSECHLSEKSMIPARILCNWDFNKYPVAKRNQHFLTLISNEPMFDVKSVAPLLYKMCPELNDIEELRRQAFFIRSYCTTCVQESISFELTKLIWPREHLIKQISLYSLEDLVQIKNGALKQVLKSVITFGRQHVLSCVLCCQKGFICELCKSSQIIYPFDIDSVYRCNECQSIYHKNCFKSKPGTIVCPRCQRLKARKTEIQQ